MDLAWRGVDLATEWRSRRWRRLLNLIDHLPRNTAFREAQATDEELARAWLRIEDQMPEAESRELFSEWSPERVALASIDDRLQEIIRVLIAANGGKPPSFRPHPRPESAAQRLRRMQRVERNRALSARVLAPRREPPALGR